MGRTLILLAVLIFSLAHVAASCQGTETGNPTSEDDPAAADEENTTPYRNDEFGVSAEIASSWEAEENDPAPSPAQDQGGEGIDTSEAPFTEFGDGTTLVTLFYVTLEEEPASLADYLASVFPSRSFEAYANDFLSGFAFDQEYYFLDGTLLLYLVADLFEENDGPAKFSVLIDSLRIED